MVFGSIETRVEEYDVRIRILGLRLLLIGFLFQLSSLLSHRLLNVFFF